MPARHNLADRITLMASGIFALVGLLALLTFGGALIRLATTNPLSDVHAYYDAAQRLNAGLPLYSSDIDINASEYYRYPPLLAVVFRPLALLPFPVAAAIWEAVLVLSFILTLRAIGGRLTAVLAVVALSLPIVWSLLLGQAQVLTTYLMVLASPLAIAVAGHLKVFPALVALYFLGRRDWRWFRQFVAVFVALAIAQLVLEPRGSIAYLGVLNLEQVGDIDNLSPYGASPALWAVLAVVGAVLTVLMARRDGGWVVAVWFATLVTPRLISYLLMSLLAALRRAPVSKPSSVEAGNQVHDGAPERNPRLPAGQRPEK